MNPRRKDPGRMTVSAERGSSGIRYLCRLTSLSKGVRRISLSSRETAFLAESSVESAHFCPVLHSLPPASVE